LAELCTRQRRGPQWIRGDAIERSSLIYHQTDGRSGVAVERLLGLKGSGPGDLLVVLDEIALELGVLRIRERGSHGGHNGLRSIIEVLGTEELPRLRVGVGKDPSQGDLAGYLLSPFSEEEVLMVQETVGRAADAVECLVRDGVATAMNLFNGPRKS